MHSYIIVIHSLYKNKQKKFLSTYNGIEEIGWRGHEWKVHFSHCILF